MGRFQGTSYVREVLLQSAAQWAATTNFTLQAFQTGRETDTGFEKTGPGTWGSLPYDQSTPISGEQSPWTGNIDGGGFTLSNVASVNKVNITTPANAAALTILDGKTLTVNKSITFDGTDGTTMTFPAASDTVAALGTSQTFTGVQTFNGTASVASAASATLNAIRTSGSTIITGSTNITTSTGFNKVSLLAPLYSAASALTITNAATFYIGGAPNGTGAGPATITNAYALWVDSGTTRLDGNILTSLPTADPHVAGMLWANSGVVTVSAG